MRVLTLHHPIGHPYWDKDEYQIEMPSGDRINPADCFEDNYGGYRVYWNDKGVWVQKCACGSGYGKVDRHDVNPVLLVSSSLYDKIEFAGAELTLSPKLKKSLAEVGWI